MGRFQLELIYYFTYFYIVVLSNICLFLSCRPFVVNITFSTSLMAVEGSFETFVCFFPVGLSLLIQHFQRVLYVMKVLLKHLCVSLLYAFCC